MTTKQSLTIKEVEDLITALAEFAPKISPLPWSACNDGECTCKTISNENHPIAQIVHGEWGDTYPDIRLVSGENTIGFRAEAYMHQVS